MGDMLNEIRRQSIISPLVFSSLLYSFFLNPSHAAKQSYIVYMGHHPGGGTDNANVNDLQLAQHDLKLTQTHYDMLASLAQSQSEEEAQSEILYSFTKCMNGFAATLNDAQADELRNHPKVHAVFPNIKYDLHTTHSWEFLGFKKGGVSPPSSLWTAGKYGQDIIIANLDTGVWPESASFKDDGMEPVPQRWKGSCSPDSGVRCNKKLIGAKFFYKGAEAAGSPLNKTALYARDDGGHGTHTLATAGGSPVPGANMFGHGNGTAIGGSPKARVAAYKVCWPAGCFGADILAGFEAALVDGADVISVSLGGAPVELYADATAIVSFNAVKKGIPVVASAGNSGPRPQTTSNISPWIFTIGASTTDREFACYVVLGDKKRLRGTSIGDKALPADKFYPLISGADAQAGTGNASAAELCADGSLDRTKVEGKIVACLRGGPSRTEKGRVVASLGAVGMVLANDATSKNNIIADPHFLPASHLTYDDGQAVFNYIKTTPNPTATISPITVEIGLKEAPEMASFSSRGPNPVIPGLLKPDVTGPGVNILAAYTEAIAPTEDVRDTRRVNFTSMSGTSMSCPHISGIAGLLKSIHPDWSPSAIKSAIMTTADTRTSGGKPILDADGEPANPFAYGAGHVRPNLAADPGLVYDLTTDDFLNALCALGYNETTVKAFAGAVYTCPKNFSLLDFNYPSITVPNLDGAAVVSRKVKNVGTPAMYSARVTEPAGITVVVEPAQLAFTKAGEEKEFKLNIKASPTAGKDYEFGELVWSDGKHSVRSPLVVKQA